MSELSSSHPPTVLMPPHLVVPGTIVFYALPIVRRVAKIIPWHVWEYIESVTYSSDPRGHLPQYEANEIHSHMSERKVREMLEVTPLPEEVHILVPRRTDTAVNSPIRYCASYLEQFRAGLRFPLILLPQEILFHYQIALSQLVPNAVRIIVGFERYCRNHRVVTSLALF